MDNEKYDLVILSGEITFGAGISVSNMQPKEFLKDVSGITQPLVKVLENRVREYTNKLNDFVNQL